MDTNQPVVDIVDIDGVVDIGSSSPEIEEHRIPIPLTNAKTSPLTTLHIEYIDDLPEYPTSHFQGYTYVVASRGRSQAEMEQIAHEIQYARRQTQGQKRPVYSPFLLCRAKKWSWKCSGIYACEYLKPSLRTCHHTSVNETLWQEFQRSQSAVQISELDVAKRNAYSLYRSKVKFFKRGHACLDQLPTCKPAFKRYINADVLGQNTPYIGCVNETYGLLNKHYRGTVKGHAAIDLGFLEELFNNETLQETEECGVIEPLASRRVFCERDHPQGPGRLEHIQCDVMFNALVPVDINECPYILFTSHGIHKHPPPPPTKPPERILQGIKQMIEQIRDPSLTTAQFLRSPQLEAFCEQYNTSTLAEIHISFCNKDRISAILQKQRLLAYPNGQDIDGVIFLQQSNQHIKDYIQETYHDSEGTMVICAYREQIQLLAQLSSFEVDMSYKRIRTKDINEVLFATFLPDQCKVITLLRVFTSDDSTRGYYLLFKRVFTLVQKLTQTPVLFDPIHGSGIYGIIMDMDSKLYTGLGQYLSEVDPQRRDITWQLERIIVFCQVHFQRSILKAIGTRSHGTPLWGLMMSLLDCNSEVEYDELLELLIENEAAAVRDWAVQKKSSIIKAGLNKACSKIQPYHFSELRNYTNAVKQAQQKSNATCKYLTLVEAITNSAKLDQSDILQYQNLTRFNIHHSYRTSEMEDNYLRHMSREGGRKRRRSTPSNVSESQSALSQPENFLESRSRYPRQNSGDDGSVRSSQNLRRTASEDALTLEQRRQELELRKLEADIRKQELDIRKQEADIKQQEVDIRLQQLKNDQLELDLMERRARIQDLQASTFGSR